MNEILHLNYNPTQAGWVLQLQTRLQDSKSTTLKERYSCWKSSGMAELGMAFVTRLELRNRAALFLVKLLDKLRDEINSSGKLNELLDGGYAYCPEDDRIFYDICLAFDALCFETRSAYEIIGKFVRNFGEKILSRKYSEQDIKKVLIDQGYKTDWIDEIRENRKLFFHETAPWIALSVSNREPIELNLVIMKENLNNFQCSEKFITQQQMFDSWQGFTLAVSAICKWLKEQIILYEKNEQHQK